MATDTLIVQNFYFNCLEYSDSGDPNQGVIEITLTPSGDWFNKTFAYQPVISLSVSVEDTFNPDQYLITTSPIEITLTVKAVEDFTFITVSSWHNWIWWSKIGELDFSLDATNEAGSMPMGFNGNIYNILKLGRVAVVYGAEGIAQMSPSNEFWGFEPVFNLGTKSALSSCGNEKSHWFIDTTGVMWSYSGQLTRIGFEEFFSEMGTISMNLFESEQLIYICDDSIGYVYSIKDNSLGEGPDNISGAMMYSGSPYVVAPDYIQIPLFELCTDIYDMGTRKEKTVFGIEVGVDADVSLQASCDFRTAHMDIFKSLPWFNVTQRGQAFFNCYGVEFRFRLRALNYEEFDLDYLKVNGVIHGFSFLDTITMR